ncbi:MAG: hypothetical protein KGN36_14795 [Acidobacteriota bacterium]|nr:hypothetical protein [Acidobacteriota bacterium]
MAFTCSICGEQSTRICARCTKDACDNHLCGKCRRCSDCCECEIVLEEPHFAVEVVPVPVPAPSAGPEAAPAAAAEPAAAPSAEDHPAPPTPLTSEI